jgi:cobalt-zinc-cadmium efflux system protein
VGHDHGHGHDHGVTATADKRWLSIALALIVGFMVVEVVVGLIAGSLALLSDAAHMLTDAASIVLALIAIRLAARPAKGSFTYGLKRTEILSAQANGITLILLSAWFAYEAIRRLIHPPSVAGGLVLITGIAGILVNLAATWSISRANRTSLNVEGAFQHILNDLFAFVATTVAGVVILVTGLVQADTFASLIVVALMLKAGLGLLRDSGRILLEAAPSGIHPDAVADRLLETGDVVEVHDMHLWLITSGQPTMSAHVLVPDDVDCHAVRHRLQALLSSEYGITHTTLEVDHASDHDSAAVGDRHCVDPHGVVHVRDPHLH